MAKQPDAEAQRILAETGQADAVPVDVAVIADHLELQIVEDRLDRAVSGLLYRDGEHVMIGVNSTHVPRRRRFTIAHEIAHYVLHKGRPVFLDHVRVNYRDETSSTATDFEEIQANAFAAELLMPAPQVTKLARQLLAAPGSTEASVLRDLANRFDVSEQAMEYRLINLGLRRQI